MGSGGAMDFHSIELKRRGKRQGKRTIKTARAPGRSATGCYSAAMRIGCGFKASR